MLYDVDVSWSLTGTEDIECKMLDTCTFLLTIS